MDRAISQIADLHGRSRGAIFSRLQLFGIEGITDFLRITDFSGLE